MSCKLKLPVRMVISLLPILIIGLYGTLAHASLPAHPGSASANTASHFVATVHFDSDELDIEPINVGLTTPMLIPDNGDPESFSTRTTEQMLNADRLQVRFSHLGGLPERFGDTGVGTFIQQLYPINSNPIPTNDAGLVSVTTTSVSKPSAYALGIAGFLFVGGISRRRRAQQLQD